MTITPELKQAVREAGEQPVRLTDPETDDAYYLMSARVFARVKDVIAPRSTIVDEVPEGIRRSQAAFFRDLPALLAQKKLRGKWVAYHGDERIGIARSDEPLIRACLKRGLMDDQYDLFEIRPQSSGTEEVDAGPYEFDEIPEAS